jgi:hypothetical protein
MPANGSAMPKKLFPILGNDFPNKGSGFVKLGSRFVMQGSLCPNLGNAAANGSASLF